MICWACSHFRENDEGWWCNQTQFPTKIANLVDGGFFLTSIGKKVMNYCPLFEEGGNGRKSKRDHQEFW